MTRSFGVTIGGAWLDRRGEGMRHPA